MAQDDSTGIIEVFALLLEKLKAEIDAQNKLGMKALEIGDLDAAQNALDRAVQITSLRDQVASLRESWGKLAVSPDTVEVPQFQQEHTNVGSPKTRRNVLNRLPGGIATPQSAYRRSILQALYEMGDSGRTKDVLVKVKQLMQGVLKDVDNENYPLTKTPRWSKFAQWERDTMREDGLIKSNSRHGVWELTETGRQAAMQIGR